METDSTLEQAALLENLPGAVARLDRDLRVLYANRAAEEMFGAEREALIGRTLAELPTLVEAVAWERICRAVVTTAREQCLNLRQLTRHGVRCYAVRIVPEPGSDGTVRSLVSLANEVADGPADVHALFRARELLLASLSHELRTPLNAILGWTQALRGSRTRKETALKALAQIEHSAQAQAKLVDALASVSDILSGRIRLNPRPMRLSPVIHAAIDTLATAISAKGIQMETTIDAAAEFTSGDFEKVRRVVENLLAIAVDYAPRQGSIRVRLAREDANAALSIAAAGSERAPQPLPDLFAGEAALCGPQGALGLGLAIARCLVEMHGGSIEARSAGKRRGIALTLRLPAGAAFDGAEIRPDPGRRHPSLAGLKILAIDDDPNTRDMLQEAIGRAGAEVLIAASAAEAVDVLQRARPDVLVSDIGMPETDGCELLRRVRTLPRDRGGATPAIALTGYAGEEDRAAARAAGYQNVVAKPVNLNELLTSIRALVPARHTPQPSR